MVSELLKIEFELTPDQILLLSGILRAGEAALDVIRPTKGSADTCAAVRMALQNAYKAYEKSAETERIKKLAKGKPSFDGEILPKIWGGCDWGVESYLLCRKGNKVLFWQKGHSQYTDRGSGTVYQSGQLQLNEGDGYNTKTLHEGGRLTVEVIQQYKTEIEAYFGETGLVERINPKNTLVLEQS